MDYVKEAEMCMEEAKRLWAEGHTPDAGITQSNLAIAAALIDIVKSTRNLDVAMVNVACLLEEIRDLIGIQGGGDT